nr:hypothetical protein [Tanacetum cinerariifolium]
GDGYVNTVNHVDNRDRSRDNSPLISPLNNKSKVAQILSKTNSILDNKLELVPSVINEKGDEVVVFNEELVEEGCEKWHLIICGYFDPHVEIVKTDPFKIPIWINLVNAPFEAWSVTGINTLASRLGRPMVMDQMTANMCKNGTRRLGFARFLVEVNKGFFLEKIKVQYKDALDNINIIKYVNVEYSWKLDLCEYCSGFGHGLKNCKVRKKSEEEIKSEIISKNANANRGNKDFFYESC